MLTADRRRRRVAAIAASVLAVLGLAAGAWFLRQAQRDTAAREARDKGRIALAAGDYAAALDGLGDYVQRFEGRGATAEDYVFYARARRHVVTPSGRHLVGAIWSLRTALALDPSCAEAKKELLDLYVEAGYATEALALAERLLEESPDDAGLLRTKCALLEATRKFAEALAVAQRICELAPDDLAEALLTVRLLDTTHADARTVDAWVDARVAAHNGNTRFGLLRAAVSTRRRDAVRAKEQIDAVLSGTLGVRDETFVALLVRELDAAGRFADSLAALERLDDAAGAELRRELVRRLWYAGCNEDVVARATRWTDGSEHDDAELVALDVLALRALGRDADAVAAEGRLAAISGDAGRAWSAYVALGRAAPVDRRATCAALSEAASAVPGSAILRAAVGDASAALGETDQALSSWAAAAEMAPPWPLPLVRGAQALLAAGRRDHALQAARAAFERAPSDAETVTAYLGVTAAAADDLDSRKLRSLLDIAAAVAKDAPQTSADLVPVSLDLLDRVDPQAAEKRLAEFAAAAANAPESVLLRLAEIAQRRASPVEGRLFDLCETQHGATPQLALARALLAARTGGCDAGLTAFGAMRARAGAAGASAEWDTVRARFLESQRSPAAAAAWASVADAHPADLEIQLGALSSEAAWKDRDTIGRVIDRVHSLTGDDGITWRIGRARWLLSAPDAAESQVAEAASLLNALVRSAPQNAAAHVLLGCALERLGNAAGAEEQFRFAAGIAPGETSVLLEVARLATLRGASGRDDLERALRNAALAPEQVERAAWLLARGGDIRRGAELLEPVAASGCARRDGVRLLARLHAKLGETERALELCKPLLTEPDEETVVLAASLYASMGRSDDAAAALARLESMSLAPGEREFAMARHAAAWGPAGSADAWFARAVDAAPSREDVWTDFAEHALSAGDAARVGEILGDPRAAAAEGVRFLAGMRAACLAGLSDSRQRALLVAALRDVRDRPALLQALRALQRTDDGAGSDEGRARALRTLADANVRVLALQLVAADACSGVRDLRSACDIARRTTGTFPESVAAARQSAELLGRSGRWAEALDAAVLWRSRASRFDEDADVFAAEAMVRSGRAKEAVAALRPRVPGALADTIRHARLLLVHAVALERTGDREGAAGLLSRVAGDSPQGLALALGVDPVFLGDPSGAAAWLTACAQSVRDSDVPARVELARSSVAAWQVHRTADLLDSARAALAPLTAARDAPATAHLLAGMLAQQSGDAAGAAKEYAAALDRDPRLADARNNLAIVLADTGRVTEAVGEATRVHREAPAVPEYLDTLAYVLRKSRDLDRARSCLEEAVRLDPVNPAWHVSLAETLAQIGDRDAAAKAAARAEELESRGCAMSADVAERIARVKRAPR